MLGNTARDGLSEGSPIKLLKFAGTILTAATIALTAPAAQAAQAAVIDYVTNGGFKLSTGSFPVGALPKGQFQNVKPTGWTCVPCATRPPYTFVDTSGSATSSNGGYAVYGGLPASSPNGGNFIQADGAPSHNAEFSQSISGLTSGMT